MEGLGKEGWNKIMRSGISNVLSMRSGGLGILLPKNQSTSGNFFGNRADEKCPFPDLQGGGSVFWRAVVVGNGGMLDVPGTRPAPPHRII